MTQRHCRIGTTPKCVCLYICVRIYIFICKRVYLCKRFKFKLCVRVYARTRVVQFGVQSKVRVCGLSRIVSACVHVGERPLFATLFGGHA
jgi:hypothetical protein